MNIFGIIAIVFALAAVFMIKHFYTMKTILSNKGQKPRKRDHFWFGFGIFSIFLAFVFGAIEFMIQVL